MTDAIRKGKVRKVPTWCRCCCHRQIASRARLGYLPALGLSLASSLIAPLNPSHPPLLSVHCVHSMDVSPRCWSQDAEEIRSRSNLQAPPGVMIAGPVAPVCAPADCNHHYLQAPLVSQAPRVFDWLPPLLFPWMPLDSPSNRCKS